MRLAWLLVIVIAGCATRPPSNSAPQPQPSSFQPQSAQQGSAIVDETSSFSDENEAARARVTVQAADDAYKKMTGLVEQFLRSSRVDCDSAALDDALQILEAVDNSGKRYLQLVLSAPDMGDREAAADVLDSLNGIVLDGLVDIAKAYRVKGCFPWAKRIIAETKRVYTGNAYEGWIGTLNSELQAIEVAERNSKKQKGAGQYRTN